MSTGWWLVLGMVVVFALVAAYVDGTGRLRRRRRGAARSRRDASRREPPPEEG
ncbi:hypothetical protein RM572_03630 [Streptomyces sp. DSM 42041]|uniref:Type II toxin-antitoxin system PemK/MazF family toxin n=1 Tax=Streptomyces hazeniae TaxID=3075538 RepID=A0ABU2NLT4_9ACTN|nr:hypothetical protein [Streptomyces sp. DSM 42041]MDT0377863.1 hypothetical protein [Streptomyces sp. DSM 42041]